MPNLDQLVITSADYKIVLDIQLSDGSGNTVAFPILTCQDLSYDIEVEDETVYAIGTIEPIAEKSNAKSYKGKIAVEAGEANAILLSTGLNDTTQIVGATLAIAAIQGAFARVFKAVNFNSENLAIKAKDKHSVINVAWKGLGVNNA